MRCSRSRWAKRWRCCRAAPLDFFLPSNVLISNVRGPAEPLYLNGARLEALCPVSTLISGMGLNITFMSYAGQVVIGFTANAAALPDADRLAQYTREAFQALERQSRATGRAAVRRKDAGRALPSPAGDQREVPAALLDVALAALPHAVVQRARCEASQSSRETAWCAAAPGLASLLLPELVEFLRSRRVRGATRAARARA